MWQCCRFAGVKNPCERLKKSTEIHKITKSTKRQQWYVETCEQLTDDDIVAADTALAEPASPAPSDEEEKEEEEGDSTSQGVHRLWRP